jgi:uncharacterized LabA/DUF88 family protein
VAEKGDTYMFVPLKPRIKAVAECYPDLIVRLQDAFGEQKTGVYIDWANVRNWSETLRWHVGLERLKESLDSFTPTPEYPRFYWGTLKGVPKSKAQIDMAAERGFIVWTKEVKRIRIAVDVSNISVESPAVLKKLILQPLLGVLPIKAIAELNECLGALNKTGTLYLENLKRNFDVEIGTDMHVDKILNSTENFLLWSGDSDFADPVEQLLNARKTVTVFATRGRIAPMKPVARRARAWIETWGGNTTPATPCTVARRPDVIH